jgi:hypothetical protein
MMFPDLCDGRTMIMVVLAGQGIIKEAAIMTRNPFVYWRRHPDLNRRITVLQTAALPLGYAAAIDKMERANGFEPSTSTLARWHSTTELRPLML